MKLRLMKVMLSRERVEEESSDYMRLWRINSNSPIEDLNKFLVKIKKEDSPVESDLVSYLECKRKIF
jgi:hypothetical protein